MGGWADWVRWLHPGFKRSTIAAAKPNIPPAVRDATFFYSLFCALSKKEISKRKSVSGVSRISQ
jgi:hypothetical protein